MTTVHDIRQSQFGAFLDEDAEAHTVAELRQREWRIIGRQHINTDKFLRWDMLLNQRTVNDMREDGRIVTVRRREGSEMQLLAMLTDHPDNTATKPMSCEAARKPVRQAKKENA